MLYAIIHIYGLSRSVISILQKFKGFKYTKYTYNFNNLGGIDLRPRMTYGGEVCFM